jgi:hypothetical protein
LMIEVLIKYIKYLEGVAKWIEIIMDINSFQIGKK